MGRYFLVVISTLINHNKDFIYGPRGYESVEDMDEDIVEKCNEVIADDDVFYILGDCVMGPDLENGLKLLDRLKGKKRIICGNHDTQRRVAGYKGLERVEVLGEAKTLFYNKMSLFLCHYPTQFSPIGPFYKENRLCLCGHTHTKDAWQDISMGSFHVEWDAWGRPIELDEVLSLMDDFNKRLRDDEIQK